MPHFADFAIFASSTPPRQVPVYVADDLFETSNGGPQLPS